jgi:hypothetical protein
VPGQIVELDDLAAVGGISKLQSKDFRVLLRLLQPVARRIGFRFCLDHGNREIAGIAQQIVGPFFLSAMNGSASNLDASIGKGHLFGDGMWMPFPTSFPNLGGQ